MLVDTFIPGMQKAGTTKLFSLLAEHPSITGAAVKEPHFFDDSGEFFHHPGDFGKYHRLYSPPNEGTRALDATPIYTFWPNCLERIRAYNKDAKLIILLRHPAFRAFSHWRMESSRDAETENFPFSISLSGTLRAFKSDTINRRVHSYTLRGFYSIQIERVLALFPRSQILFLKTDELWTAENEALTQVYDFLSLAPQLPRDKQTYISPTEYGLAKTGLSKTSFLELLSMYESDIVRTERLTSLSLQDWRSPDYREPMGGVEIVE
ncbi:MAG: sulfotransferase domain-containing protein [Pseudomonadota bacterium]